MSKRPIARIRRFKPGDLITADDLNRLLDAIEALEDRVAALEGKAAPRGAAKHHLHIGAGPARAAAAAAFAKAEGRDLYRVDLAAIVSKYIGETEKNLAAAFAAAEKSGAVLFFDEADALFGKRSEVKDAHDRYANAEINYLLERLEQYDALAILALSDDEHVDPIVSRCFDTITRLPL